MKSASLAGGTGVYQPCAVASEAFPIGDRSRGMPEAFDFARGGRAGSSRAPNNSGHLIGCRCVSCMLSASTTMNRFITLCSLMVWLAGCACNRPAHLSNTWVIEAGPGRAGIAPQPHNAEPLLVSQPDQCIPSNTFDQEFGKQCDHETEGGGSVEMGGALTPGAHPTHNEVRWYCPGRTVMRLVIQRCPDSDNFRIVDVSISLSGGS